MIFLFMLFLPPKLSNFVPCFAKVCFHCQDVTSWNGDFKFLSQGLLQQCFPLQSAHCTQFIFQLGTSCTTTGSCPVQRFQPLIYVQKFSLLPHQLFSLPQSFSLILRAENEFLSSVLKMNVLIFKLKKYFITWPPFLRRIVAPS